MSNDTPLPLRVPRERRDAWATYAGQLEITLSELLRRGAETMLWSKRLLFESTLRALTPVEAGILAAMDPELDINELTRSPSKRRRAG